MNYGKAYAFCISKETFQVEVRREVEAVEVTDLLFTEIISARIKLT